MIHRHIFSVRRVPVDEGVAAVTEVNTSPRSVWLKEVRAVVLRTTDAEVGIGRVNRDALELCCTKGGGIAIVYPSQTRIGRLPNATIVPGVNDRRIRRRDTNRVAVDMQPVVAWRKAP